MIASKVRDVSPSLGSGSTLRASLRCRASVNHLRVAGLVLLVRAAWVWIRAWISAFASGEVSGGSTSASSNTASRAMTCPTRGRLDSPVEEAAQRRHAKTRDTSQSMLPIVPFPCLDCLICRGGMLAKVYSVAVSGLDAYSVEVEVDLAAGLPMFTVVGLPDLTVRESRERGRSALRNSGFSFPQRKITVNLAPADLRTERARFHLPIAVGVLAAEGIIPAAVLRELVMVGEVSLEGAIKPVHGALSMALACRSRGIKGLLVP